MQTLMPTSDEQKEMQPTENEERKCKLTQFEKRQSAHTHDHIHSLVHTDRTSFFFVFFSASDYGSYQELNDGAALPETMGELA